MISKTVKTKSNLNLSEYAGSLKMNNEEIETMFRTLSDGWKKWRRQKRQ